MAINYFMSATCDQCGKDIRPLQKVNITDQKSARWKWEDEWKREMVMQNDPSLYGKRKLFCRTCAG